MASSQQTGLFFMGATPQVALKVFPVQFKGSAFKQLDKHFIIILAICGIILGSLFFVLSMRPLAEVMTDNEIQKIQERYAQLVLNQPKKVVQEAVELETKEVKSQEEKVDESAKEEVKVDRKKESVVEKKMRREASREERKKKRDAIQQQVQTSGIFAAITATGGGGSGSSSPVTDLLGAAAEGVGSISDVSISEGSFATKEVDPEMLKKRRGEKTSGVGIETQAVGRVAGTQIASAGEVNITTAPPELKGESAGKGSRSQAAINRVVSAEQSRLKKVYEAMLKRDPNLSGKLMIKFTILEDGSVADVSIVQSTTNNPTFDKRILTYVARWKFPPVDGGGVVEVVFPFVFTGST